MSFFQVKDNKAISPKVHCKIKSLRISVILVAIYWHFLWVNFSGLRSEKQAKRNRIGEYNPKPIVVHNIFQVPI